MQSRVALLVIVVGVAVLTQPVVGNGPGPDRRYTYAGTEVNLTNDEAVEALYAHSMVEYGTGETLRPVREATNETVSRPLAAVPDPVRELTRVKFLADDVGDQYYRLDARVDGNQFRLDATRVSERAVAEELAVRPQDAPRTIRDALDGNESTFERVNATLVRTDGRYVLVRAVKTELVPDPYVLVKVPAYAVGLALVVLGLVAGPGIRRRR